MEIYLLIALFFVYIMTNIFISHELTRKIWTISFIAAFLLSSITLLSLRISNQDVMMTSNNLNWYYLLYVFGSLAIGLGVINLWIYRKDLWHLFTISEKNNSKE